MVHKYNADVVYVQKHGGHHRGVKRNSNLNDISGYHVTNNWTLDIMHIVLKGIIPFELGCILHGLCVREKIMTLPDINRNLQLLWGKLTVDKNKPTELSKLELP